MQNLTYLLMARGHSHIKYFNKLKAKSDLDIAVIRCSRTLPQIASLSYLKRTSFAETYKALNNHFAKKRKVSALADLPIIGNLLKTLRTIYEQYKIAHYCALIAREDADVVGVWNGQKLPSSSIKKAALLLGKQVVHFENGLLPDTTVCDWQGVNCDNSLPATQEFYRQFEQCAKLPTSLYGHNSKIKQKHIDQVSQLPKNYIFVPFQVETDSQIIRNSPWIKSMDELFNLCLQFLDENPDLHFVFKTHPCEKRSYAHLYHQHKRATFSSESTETLIKKSSAVITINSTVGIESILFAKKVITLGKACYSIPNLTMSANNTIQLASCISNLQDFKVDESVRLGFLSFVYQQYSIPKRWDAIDQQHVKAIENRLLKTDELAQFVTDSILATETTTALAKKRAVYAG